MCDDHTVQDEETPKTALTRREFNTLAAGATLAFSLPKTANAQSVTLNAVQVNTSDGVCDAFFVHPKEGNHPAVLILSLIHI